MVKLPSEATHANRRKRRQQADASHAAVLQMPTTTDQTNNAVAVMTAYRNLNKSRQLPILDLSERIETMLPLVRNPVARNQWGEYLIGLYDRMHDRDLLILDAGEKILATTQHLLPEKRSGHAMYASALFHKAMKRDRYYAKTLQCTTPDVRLEFAVRAQRVMSDADRTAHMGIVVPLVLKKHRGKSITTEQAADVMGGLLETTPRSEHAGYIALLQKDRKLRAIFGTAGQPIAARPTTPQPLHSAFSTAP